METIKRARNGWSFSFVTRRMSATIENTATKTRRRLGGIVGDYTDLALGLRTPNVRIPRLLDFPILWVLHGVWSREV
jgi:hypothetical protein